MTTIRIATRSSAQARTQAEAVGALLVAARTGVVVEYVFVDTQGDINATTPLHLMGGQGVFVKEVQRAVLDNRADIAVHSAKDLPSQNADGLFIGAIGERRTANDALVGKRLEDLAVGATIGVSPNPLNLLEIPLAEPKEPVGFAMVGAIAFMSSLFIVKDEIT